MVEIIDIKKRKIDKKNEVRRKIGETKCLCSECGKEMEDFFAGGGRSYSMWNTKTGEEGIYICCKLCCLEKDKESLKEEIEKLSMIIQAMWNLAVRDEYPEYGLLVCELEELKFYEKFDGHYVVDLYERLRV